MNYLKPIALIFLFFCLAPSKSYAQCLCGDIYYFIKLPQLNIVENKLTNYSIETNYEYSHIGYIHETAVREDTLRFSFPTGGGIDTLVFTIKDLSNQKEMKITTIGIPYDIHHYVELLEFQEGHYIFDFIELRRCYSENKDQQSDCTRQRFKKNLDNHTPFIIHLKI